MKKTKKLDLNDLKVESFVTGMEHKKVINIVTGRKTRTITPDPRTSGRDCYKQTLWYECNTNGNCTLLPYCPPNQGDSAYCQLSEGYDYCFNNFDTINKCTYVDCFSTADLC